MFYCEFCEISKNSFLQNTSEQLLLILVTSLFQIGQITDVWYKFQKVSETFFEILQWFWKILYDLYFSNALSLFLLGFWGRLRTKGEERQNRPRPL